MSRLFSVVSLLGVLIFAPAFADQTQLKPQSEGGINFVSGGVGGDERNEMQALRAGYNLRLLFSEKGTGEYLSDVEVRIKDASGSICLVTVTEGPILLVKLKPGGYNVSAEQNGYEINKKAIIGGKKNTSLSFAWPRE